MSALLPTYAPFPFIISHGEADRIFADDGRVFWDFYGGHCVASTGHSHTQVVDAISAQAAKLLFYSTAGAMPIRERAADALIKFAQQHAIPSALDVQQVFFCNSGAEANENAIKIAHKLTGRSTIVSFSGGWHGRSLVCLAATDDAKITEPYASWLPAHRRLPFNDLAALAAADFSDVCAVIIEPIQSLAGICVADAEFLQALRAKTDEAGCMLIFDEIQTGIGRLGLAFAANYFGIYPDLITCAKGLASGVPIGAVLMRASIARALKQGDLGSTFGGGPLACAAVLATLSVIESEALMYNARAMHLQLSDRLTPLGIRMRGAGLLLGLEHPRAEALRAHLFAEHILVGGSSNAQVLRLMPPLNLSQAAVDALIAAIKKFLQH